MSDTHTIVVYSIATFTSQIALYGKYQVLALIFLVSNHIKSVTYMDSRWSTLVNLALIYEIGLHH